MGSSKEEKREKKGRKELEGDKIKITSQRWGLPSPALKWPLLQARLPLCCGSVAPCPPVWATTTCPVGSRLAITIHTHTHTRARLL